MVLCTSPLLCLRVLAQARHIRASSGAKLLGRQRWLSVLNKLIFHQWLPPCVFAPLQSRDKTRPFHLVTAPHECTCPAMKQLPLRLPAVKHTPAHCLFLTLTLLLCTGQAVFQPGSSCWIRNMWIYCHQYFAVT